MNQLEEKITRDNLELLTKIVKEDKTFLHALYKEGKGVGRREKLYRDIEALSPYKIDLLLSNLSEVLNDMIKANDEAAVSNTIHFYDRYRKGLEVSDLKRLLEDESLNEEIRLTIALSLSNAIRDSDYWLTVIQSSKNNFMLPAVINALNTASPREALKLFKEIPYTKLKLLYIPLKRAMLNIFINIKEADIRLVADILADLETSQSFEKCELLHSILKHPNLKFVSEKVNEIRENDYADISPIVNISKQISKINSNTKIEDLDDIFSDCEPDLIFEVTAIDLRTKQFFKPQYFALLKWLEHRLGNVLAYRLKEFKIHYNKLLEVIQIGNNRLVLNIKENQHIEKLKNLEKGHGSNRIKNLNQHFRS